MLQGHHTPCFMFSLLLSVAQILTIQCRSVHSHNAPHYQFLWAWQGAHSPGEPGKQGKVREFKSGRENSGKRCSCIWSITASIDLDTKCAIKGFVY